jgi:hypothetical protein
VVLRRTSARALWQIEDGCLPPLRCSPHRSLARGNLDLLARVAVEKGAMREIGSGSGNVGDADKAIPMARWRLDAHEVRGRPRWSVRVLRLTTGTEEIGDVTRSRHKTA